MTTRTLTKQKAAVQEALTEAFDGFYGYIHVTSTSRGGQEALTLRWTGQPSEGTITDLVAGLRAQGKVNVPVEMQRTEQWRCGNAHADAEDAWLSHEGRGHLEWDHDRDEYALPEEVREELEAGGEEFTSHCVPGPYAPCPTCGGGSRVMASRTNPFAGFTECPTCKDLGLMGETVGYWGVLDLNDPRLVAFYADAFTQHLAKRDTKAARAKRAYDAAVATATTWAPATWVALPTLAAGILAGHPVPKQFGCDHLTHAGDPDRAVCCGNKAAWFDASTGLRVCTKHKNAEPMSGPLTTATH